MGQPLSVVASHCGKLLANIYVVNAGQAVLSDTSEDIITAHEYVTSKAV